MELYDWDMADHINTKEEVFAYLEGALEENNIETLFDIIGAIARSQGMAKIAKETGLNRESLYKSLSRDGNPSFATIAKVIDVLGYRIEIKQKTA
ncbi:MAG: putative addiction module antidote protein [Treponema sp.]|jgi:probable addiction module antidote protein|nr:putative addiction module antidote protein [Treponema sp.]